MSGDEAVAAGSIAGAVSISLSIEVAIPAWMHCDGLACHTENAHLFFPETYALSNKAAVDEARRLCYDCPVIDQCFEWAVARPCLDGIWAGTTPLERRRIRKAQQRKAAS